MYKLEEMLENFLSEIFDRCPVRISIKTRLGMKDPAEFERILAIYNRFPVSELIVHPRIREDLYREPVRPEWFAPLMAIMSSKWLREQN